MLGPATNIAKAMVSTKASAWADSNEECKRGMRLQI